MQRKPRQHDEAHLAWIRQLPCLVCGNNIETEACHIRLADPSIAKPITGIANKPHDKFTVPMCGKCHRNQHNGSERGFWSQRGLDPVKIGLALFSVSEDYESGMQIISASLDGR